MAQDTGREAGYYTEQSKPAKWLVMIYLAGNNNLSANCLAILQELEEAFESYPQHSDDVRVLACFDSNTPRPRGARYFEIYFRRKHHRRRGRPNWALHNDLVPLECLPGYPVQAHDFCCEEPGDEEFPTQPVVKEGLSRFIRFALENHPADKRMLILFGHGSAVAGNTFLADNTPPSFLRLKELRTVLARHFDARQNPLKAGDEDPADDLLTEEEKKRRKSLDILACDNCMMNGIESAFEIRRRVKYIIGSQGLVLALGWPFRKIIEEVLCNKNAPTERIARGILKVCARNLLDFVLMDRSSEQSLCNLTTFRKEENLVTAINRLSCVLQAGLAYDPYTGAVTYPDIRDAVRLARLEAQSYWSETFVDLYDFCSLLLERSTVFLSKMHSLVLQIIEFRLHAFSEGAYPPDEDELDLREAPPFKQFGDIADACWDVLEAIGGKRDDSEKDARRKRDFVQASYYVGPELQYSNGVSIYFPWTLPEAPIIFDSVPPSGGGGSYGVSWGGFRRGQETFASQFAERLAAGKTENPEEYQLRTAFDEYKDYDFAKCDGGDWAAFLTAFFRATLRDVRLRDRKYVKVLDDVSRFYDINGFMEDKRDFVFTPSPIDLQKSSSDADSETDCTCPTIKNYPRRFYLSPADCIKRCPIPGRDEDCREHKERAEPCVPYYGWHVRGIVAQVIKKRPPKSRAVVEGGLDDDDEEA